jgi:hypothetical protein
VTTRTLASHRRALQTFYYLLFTSALVLTLCSALLLKDPRYFWHCDFQLWFSPIYEDIARSWSAGEWPILSLDSWTTGNLAGEYQCGTFSLFHNAALVVLWKLPLTLPGKAAAFAMLYLCVLASGTVLLALRQRISPPAAVLAGICASCNGWIMAWAASQWFVALAGFAWVPWCWWAFECALKTKSARIRWLLPAPFVYLTISAGSPFAVLMLTVITAWLTIKTLATTSGIVRVPVTGTQASLPVRTAGFQPAPDSPPVNPRTGRMPVIRTGWKPVFLVRVRTIAPIAFGTLAGIALSAPSWMALIEYHRFSTRGDWGLLPQWSWVVPWRAWLGLLWPAFQTEWTGFFGKPEQHICIEMAGALLPLLALAIALRRNWRGVLRRERWLLALLAVSIVLVSIPMYGSFRWSFRILPLFHLTFVLLGARFLTSSKAMRVALIAFVLTCAGPVIVLGLHFIHQGSFDPASSKPNIAYYPATAVIVWLWRLTAGLLRYRAERRAAARWLTPVAATALLIVSLYILPPAQAAFTHPFTDNLRSPAPLDPHRLYLDFVAGEDFYNGQSAPLGWGAVLRPANTPLAADLHFLNGYSSFPGEGVPALFEVFGDLRRDRAEELVSPAAAPMLDLLGVDGLIFGPTYAKLAERLGPEWRLAHVSAEARVYHREPARAARVKTLAALEDRPGQRFAQPHISELRERRTSVSLKLTPAAASEPQLDAAADIGLLAESAPALPVAIVFARPFYPGYIARLNGIEYPVRAYAHALPLVELPAGAQGTVEFSYEPGSLRYGVPIALLTALLLAIGGAGCAGGRRAVSDQIGGFATRGAESL